jgi:hypothetical protein
MAGDGGAHRGRSPARFTLPVRGAADASAMNAQLARRERMVRQQVAARGVGGVRFVPLVGRFGWGASGSSAALAEDAR